MKNLKSLYSKNLEVKNPVIAASSGLTGTVEQLKRLEDAGAGAAVMKSLFEDAQCRSDPSPRYKIIQRGKGKLKSHSFYSYEQASKFGPEEYAGEIFRAKEAVDFPVIGSIACISDDGWDYYSRLVEEAGADAIELNLSCPYSDHTKNHRSAMEDFIIRTLSIVKKAVDLDIVCKMTPQLSDPVSTALVMQNNGASGITAFSRFAGLDIDIETEKPVMHGGYAGHGGSWSLFYALRWISEISSVIEIPISGSGGVQNGDDVVKFILAGASTIQVCTALYFEGFKVIKNYLDTLEKFMEEKEYADLNDFKNNVSDKILSMHQIDRKQRVKAVIMENECNSCDICRQLCNFYAIDIQYEKEYIINDNLCSGCGLCVEMCPRNAIRIINI